MFKYVVYFGLRKCMKSKTKYPYRATINYIGTIDSLFGGTSKLAANSGANLF